MIEIKRKLAIFAVIATALPLVACAGHTPTPTLEKTYTGNSLSDVGEAAYSSLLGSYVEEKHNTPLSAQVINQKVEPQVGEEMPLILRFDLPSLEVPDIKTNLNLTPTKTITTTETKERIGSVTVLRADVASKVIEVQKGDKKYYGFPTILPSAQPDGDQINFTPQYTWFQSTQNGIKHVTGDILNTQEPVTATEKSISALDGSLGYDGFSFDCQQQKNALISSGWQIIVIDCEGPTHITNMWTNNPKVIEGYQVNSAQKMNVAPEKVTLNLVPDTLCTNCIGGKGVEKVQETTDPGLTEEIRNKVIAQMKEMNENFDKHLGLPQGTAFFAPDFERMVNEKGTQVVPIKLIDFNTPTWRYRLAWENANIVGLFLKVTDKTHDNKTVLSFQLDPMSELIKPQNTNFDLTVLNTKLKTYTNQELMDQLQSGVIISPNAIEIGSFQTYEGPEGMQLRAEMKNRLQALLLDRLVKIPEGKKASFFIRTKTASGVEAIYLINKVTTTNTSATFSDSSQNQESGSFAGSILFFSGTSLSTAQDQTQNSSAFNQQIKENVDLNSYLANFTTGSVYLIVE